VSSRSAVSLALGLSAALVAPPRQDAPHPVAPAPKAAPPAPKPSPAWQPIEATTFEEREAADPAGRPAAEDVLVLPYNVSASFLPPRFVSKGGRISNTAEPFRGVSRLLPRLPIHDEYLKQREALGKDGLALVDWCRKNHLDDCAEFEASCRMNEIDDFQKPEYKPYLERWLAIRDRRQVAFSLPLPLEGEWHVLPDSTGHHRKKAFAAYAFDLVKRVDDKVCRGKGETLADFYGFGQPIVAQADGVVVSADDHFPDNPPGKVGGFEDANAVVVNYGGGLLVDYGHLQHGSAKVKEGQRVVRGTPLGSVGNSGASGLPHLHTSVMDWGYDSIRARYTGEVRRGARWVAFAGEDLEKGTTIRNAPAPAAPGPTSGR
jgi:hypothetical protein